MLLLDVGLVMRMHMSHDHCVEITHLPQSVTVRWTYVSRIGMETKWDLELSPFKLSKAASRALAWNNHEHEIPAMLDSCWHHHEVVEVSLLCALFARSRPLLSSKTGFIMNSAVLSMCHGPPIYESAA